MIGWFRFSVKYSRIRKVLLTSNKLNLQIMIKTCYSLLALYNREKCLFDTFWINGILPIYPGPESPACKQFSLPLQQYDLINQMLTVI